MYLMRILGALFGAIASGFWGACIGFFIGVWLDRLLANKAFRFAGYTSPAMARQTMSETLFLLMGHLAKSDGRVSEAEINVAEQAIRAMPSTIENRAHAIERFKRGMSADFDFEKTLADFSRCCKGRPMLRYTMLSVLMQLALADGGLHPKEREILSHVAIACGVSSARFEQILSMHLAQQNFRKGFATLRPRGDEELRAAYEALGCTASDNDQQIKRAYRRLIKDNHPDKLIARGMPEEMIQLATEKSQQIQTAYDLVKNSRGF